MKVLRGGSPPAAQLGGNVACGKLIIRNDSEIDNGVCNTYQEAALLLIFESDRVRFSLVLTSFHPVKNEIKISDRNP